MFVIDTAIISVLLGFVLPLVVGIITKKVESGQLKGALLLTASALTGLLNSALTTGGVLTKDAIIGAVTAYGVALASYYGVWKPTGAANYVQENVGRTD
jgi:predicted membrane-bound spermidine synthase